MRRMLGILTVMVACAPRAPEPEVTRATPSSPPVDPRGVASVSEPVVLDASSGDEAAGGSEPWQMPPAPPMPLPPGRHLKVTLEPHVSEMHGPQQPTAPCDFDRLYRGGVGGDPSMPHTAKATLSLWLQKDASGAVGGSIHYDRAGALLPTASVTVESDGGFEIVEKGGGTFRGRCEAGVLAGTFEVAGQTSPFVLHPRPAHWPALYEDRRSKDVGSCSVSQREVRYFGGTPAVRRIVNRALDGGRFAEDVREVGRCTEHITHDSVSDVMFVGEDVLTVQRFRSSDYGGAHPFHSSLGGTTVDLTTGRIVTLDQIVRDETKLRPLFEACLRDYLAIDLEKEGTVAVADLDLQCGDYPADNYLWYCDPKERRPRPNWAIVKDGVAILASGHAHVEAYLDGKGPILSWAALKREGALNPRSPIARLYKDVPAAGDDEPACTSAFTGMHVARWEVVQK
ncbi:MAG: hypothetical protein RIF41_35865 [Polyangiaceae bacterium]